MNIIIIIITINKMQVVSLTRSGAVLGDLLASLVSPIDPHTEETKYGPYNSTDDHDQHGDEPHLIDQW